MPLADAGLIDSAIESNEGLEELMQELREHQALAFRIAWISVRLVLVVVFARLVFVQRTKPALHLLSVSLLAWVLGQIGAVFTHQLFRALSEGRLEATAIWLWHVALRDLGMTAATALVGGLAGYILLRRRTNRR